MADYFSSCLLATAVYPIILVSIRKGYLSFSWIRWLQLVVKLIGIRSFWCCIISEHPHLSLPKGRKSLVRVVRGLLAAMHNGSSVSAALRTPLRCVYSSCHSPLLTRCRYVNTNLALLLRKLGS